MWWLFVLALFYASARWTAVGVVIRVFFFAFGVVGLLMLMQTGFLPVFIKAVVEVPLLLFQGAFGLSKAVMLSQ